MTVTTLAPLDFYAAHGCALFPIPYGSKAPFGIVSSFAHDWSRDPAQWAVWSREHNCNFGLVSGPSHWIIADVDVAEVGRDAAWGYWTQWCESHGLPVYAPYCQSARGGWHIAFTLPAGFDVSALRQVPLVSAILGVSKKAIIDMRVGNGFVVAAGSYYDGTAKGENSGFYSLFPGVEPHPAPDALLAALTRTRSKTTVCKPGTADLPDTIKVVTWMTEHGFYSSYDEWREIGMILRAEFGDDPGFEIWQITNDGTCSADMESSKWDSFSTEKGEGVGIGTLRHKAGLAKCPYKIGTSVDAMFAGVSGVTSATVTQIIKDAGGTPSAKPLPLMDTQTFVAALGQGYLDNFLAGTAKDAGGRPSDDFPTLPDNQSAHPLYEQMRTAIERIAAMTEGGSRSFRQDRVLNVLKVLHHMHPPTCDSLCQRITSLPGCVISPGKLDSAIKNFEWEVRSEQNTSAGFITDSKGNPAPENSDNVKAFARQRAVSLRYNTWKEQVEVADGEGAFGQLTDHYFGDLLMDAKNSAFNYHPSEGLFRRGLVSIARRNLFDPLVEKLDALAAAWDGTARLDQWISRACGTPDDAYHRAVSRNLIGGLVRRARHPGCEQSETVIFISPKQGTGKSTLCKILALDLNWHTDSFKFEGSAQNTIPQLFGKWLIELSELTGLAQKDVEHVKSFLSATSDNFTRKYEAFATDHPRRCCFVGTSNSKRPLSDSSGNRRFLPVHVAGEVDTDWLRVNIEQIMGECAVLESAGESFGIPRDIWDAAGQHQEAARAMSPVEELCQEWFDRPHTAAYGYYITATDIGRALKMSGQSSHARYASFLDKMEWRNENLIVPGTGRKCRVWVRHSTNDLERCARLDPVQRQINERVEMRPTMMPIAAPPY